MGIIFNNTIQNDESSNIMPFTFLIDDEELFQEYKNTDNGYYIDDNKTKKISKKLVLDLLEKRDMWKYLYNMFSIDGGVACSIASKNTLEVITVTKTELTTALKEAYKDTNMLERVFLLCSAVTINACYDYYEQYEPKYKCVIDGNIKEISTKKLLDILTCSDKRFERFINNKSTYPLSVKEIAYMLVDFVNKNSLFDMYSFSKEQIDRFNGLMNYKYIDFESINRFNNPNVLRENSLNSKYDISADLKRKVLYGMDPTYDELEQAIYIYIRLCDLLSLDERQAASYKDVIKEDVNYDKLYLINDVNNKIVSSEFSLILAKLLFELGFKVHPHLDCISGFSEKYAYITFKQGEYLSKIDVFNKSIIRNDMSSVKIGKPIYGIKCLNTNKATKYKFKEKVEKVYNDYIKIHKKEEVLAQGEKSYYDEMIKHYNEVSKFSSISDEVEAVLKGIDDVKLTGLDLANYLLELISMTVILDDNITYELVSFDNGDQDFCAVYLAISVDNVCFMVNLFDKTYRTIAKSIYTNYKINTSLNITEYDKYGMKKDKVK